MSTFVWSKCPHFCVGVIYTHFCGVNVDNKSTFVASVYRHGLAFVSRNRPN